MVLEHEGEYDSRWAAMTSISAKIGCKTETLRLWMTLGASGDVAERLKALKRENRELRQANELMRKAAAYFAQAELDRPFKP